MTSSSHRENTRGRGSMENTEEAKLLPHNGASHGVHDEILVGGAKGQEEMAKKKRKDRSKTKN
jgi:hypothetical protein